MGIQILKFKKFEKNTLCGFVDLQLEPSGLEIRECTYHEKEQKRWLGLPAKPYQKDGKTAYSYIVAIPDKAKWGTFQSHAIVALDKYLEDHPEKAQGNDQIPF